jgi:hypothetical protein
VVSVDPEPEIGAHSRVDRDTCIDTLLQQHLPLVVQLASKGCSKGELLFEVVDVGSVILDPGCNGRE